MVTGDAWLHEEAVRFATNFVRYGLYANGLPAEMERTRSGSEKIAYTANVIGNVGIIGDILARHGDARVFTFTTREGQGGPRAVRSRCSPPWRRTRSCAPGQIVVRASGGDRGVIDGHQRAAHTSHAPANRAYRSTLVTRSLHSGFPARPLAGWARATAHSGATCRASCSCMGDTPLQ